MFRLPVLCYKLLAQKVKRLPTMWETWVRYLGREDPLEEEMATHSSTLAWKIHAQRSQTGYSPWGRRESDTTELHKHAQPTSDKCKGRWHTEKQQREMSNLFNSKHFFIHTLSVRERIDILKNCSQGGCMDRRKEGVWVTCLGISGHLFYPGRGKNPSTL